MDNATPVGSSGSDDIFSYVPPNMMYDGFARNRFSSKEEMERYNYNHDKELTKYDRDNLK